jgi:hypothetical protein
VEKPRRNTNTIQDAENAIRQRFAADNFRGRLQYNFNEVIETEQWWHIPVTWVGCKGFIVNKNDLYVNWLGSSAAMTLEQCFWGHDRGVYCDLVDFAFAPDTNPKIVARLVSRFQHTHPDAKGVLPHKPVWYRESELPTAITRQFPLFRRHFVWLAIPELIRETENEGLRFTCCLPRQSRGVGSI